MSNYKPRIKPHLINFNKFNALKPRGFTTFLRQCSRCNSIYRTSARKSKICDDCKWVQGIEGTPPRPNEVN